MMNSIVSRKNGKVDLVTVGIVAACIIIAVVMVYMEINRRAKREFLEGEKYLSFYRNPDLKKQYYDEQLGKKEINEIEYQMKMEDNALKNAYVQYQTVVDLFTPPESEWVKKSRQRLAEITPEYNAWVKQLQSEVEKASTAPVKKPK
jgi:hypothetical protein